MERLNKLPRNQVLKELQSYKKYQNNTQKEIGTQFGSIDALRSELQRLEAKSSKIKSSKRESKIEELIYLEGKAYTKEELIKMVNYYHEHVILPSMIPELNNDIIKEIMFNANAQTLKSLCLTNKAANQYCNDNNFWKDKFQHDHLPNLVIIKKHQAKGHKLEIPSTMKRLPKNIKQWLNAYVLMFSSNQIAIKLVNNIISTNIFNYFQVNVDIQLALWLPKVMIDYIVNDDQHEIDLYFEIKNNKFYLELITQMEEEDENTTALKIEVSRQEFINYLTMLLYYQGNDENFGLMEVEDEENDRYLHMKDFKGTKGTKHIKSFFSNW